MLLFSAGRGKKTVKHPGNRCLRAIVREQSRAYHEADKTSKSYLIMNIVHSLEKESPDGIAFVKFDSDNNCWCVPPPKIRRTNVAQVFRDNLWLSYRSSKYSKQQRRMFQRAKNGVDEAEGMKNVQGKAVPAISLVAALAKTTDTTVRVGHQVSDMLTESKEGRGMNQTPTPLSYFVDQALDICDEQPYWFNNIDPLPLTRTYCHNKDQQSVAPEPSLQSLLTGPMLPDFVEDQEVYYYQQQQQPAFAPPFDAFEASEASCSLFLQSRPTAAFDTYCTQYQI